MDPRPKYFKSVIHESLFLFILCMAQFLTQAGITMSLSTMNIILESFEEAGGKTINSSQKVWFMGSFALTVGTFILVSGKLGDLFGLKLIFNIGWIWVFVWSIITGFSYYSGSLVFFIICRAFQGIGFALLLPCAIGILGNVYPNGDRKNLAFGIVGASAPTGATIGALVAAIFGQLVWWPWAFWLLGIFSGLFGVISFFAIPKNINPNLNSFKENLRRLDIIGSSVGIIGLILLNFAWNQGPIVGWSTPYIIVLLICSIICICLFFHLEVNVVKYPLLPKSIFNVRIGLVLLIIGFGWGSFGIWQYYYWCFILNLRHYTPIQGGLTYIPFLILGIIAALLSSVIIAKTKPSYILTFSAVAFMCGSIMLSIMPVHQSFFQVSMGTMFLLCWAMDISFPSAAIILSNYLPTHHQGMAGSLVSTVINYSVSLFLGMSSTVEVKVFRHHNDILKSYRAAAYMGIGVAGLGVLFSIIFIAVQHSDDPGTFDSKEDLLQSSSTLST